MERGESIIITDHGRPVAKIVPFQHERKPLLGILEGIIAEYIDPLEPVGEDDWEILK